MLGFGKLFNKIWPITMKFKSTSFNSIWLIISIIFLLILSQFYLQWQYYEELYEQQKKIVHLTKRTQNIFQALNIVLSIQSNLALKSTKWPKYNSFRSKRDLETVFRWIDDDLNNNDDHNDNIDGTNHFSKRQITHSSIPSVDLFHHPQPTDQPSLPGYTWLNSYSRIPVSTFL